MDNMILHNNEVNHKTISDGGITGDFWIIKVHTAKGKFL